MEDGRYQVLLAKIYSKMEKIDEAIVSLQQVNRKRETSVKACYVLTFIPSFTFIQVYNLSIFANEENSYIVGIKHQWLVQNIKTISG